MLAVDCMSQSAPVVALAWRVTNSSTPSTLLSRGSHFGISTAQRLKLVSGVGVAGRPAVGRLLEQRRTGLDAIGGGIDEGIERVAVLDRHRPLLGIVERIGELRRRLQRLEERHHVPDLGLGVEAVLAPGRHHRLRIVDPGIEDVVEQPLVGAAGGADLRQIGADIARQCLRLRPHDVAGEAAAAAAAVEGELLALGGIAGHFLDDDLAAPGRRDGAFGERVVVVPARLGPIAIALPRLRRG